MPMVALETVALDKPLTINETFGFGAALDSKYIYRQPNLPTELKKSIIKLPQNIQSEPFAHTAQKNSQQTHSIYRRNHQL
jgi:hypothetical protein